MRPVTLGAILALVSFALPALAQDQPARQRYLSVIGTVAKTDGQSLTVKTDKGDSTTVKFDDRTSFLRIPAGETDVKKAVKAASGEVGAGDRILARVRAEDPAGTPAATVYITKQAEIAQRQQKTREEWQTQSLTGAVKAIDADDRKIVISVRGPAGAPRDVTLDISGNVDYQRTNPDTLKYEPSALAAIQEGDQVRVLGEKNADQTLIKAEAIASGSIKTIPVQIKSIDTATGMISATDLASKKPITISVKPETTMKRLDDATALMLARRLNPTFQGGARGGAGGGQAGAGQGGAPTGGDAGGGQNATAGGGGRGLGGGGRGRGGRGGAAANDPSRLLETQASIELPDLKPGEPIVVTGSAAKDMSRLTAMTLVAGVDPILRAAPQNGPDPLGGNWNFGDVAPPQ
jgi:hypothetical protein